MKTTYNKAIRDRIPIIIHQSGKTYTVETLSDTKFIGALEAKLSEELQEYQQSKRVEELIDLLEVIYRLAELKGVPTSKLENMRQEKAALRGTFDNNLFLVDTDDKSD